MSIHVSFKNMKHSDAVKEHVHELFDDLLKITDNKYPFHVHLTRQKAWSGLHAYSNHP